MPPEHQEGVGGAAGSQKADLDVLKAAGGSAQGSQGDGVAQVGYVAQVHAHRADGRGWRREPGGGPRVLAPSRAFGGFLTSMMSAPPSTAAGTSATVAMLMSRYMMSSCGSDCGSMKPHVGVLCKKVGLVGRGGGDGLAARDGLLRGTGPLVRLPGGAADEHGTTMERVIEDGFRNQRALILTVKGCFTPDWAIAYLRHLPDEVGGAAAGASAIAASTGLSDQVALLRARHPDYLFVDPMLGMEVQGVPRSQVRAVHDPAPLALRHSGPGDALEEDALAVSRELQRASGVSWSAPNPDPVGHPHA